ncbi:MAG: DNA-directed RNA polymerase subunit beta' [Ruminococcaceae bacterium]|nr:DNA-directed RNA polymerase subunit beta' [Oscillospiraceae bacterium]MBQ8897418.1 DNA-directed RNA polymerase subunit beta' [Clostridia bacterium]
MSKLEFSAIKIGIASPEMIRSWSYGEVKKPETINYRTLKPEREGLFCERIFGPTKDWECHCGKYKKVRFKGKICERCGVEVTKKAVRRERMGHIELAAPVSHIWYFRGIPSRMGLILDITPKILERVLYFSLYIVTEPGDTPLQKMQTLTEKEYQECYEKYENDFKAEMGAEAIQKLLAEIDLDALSKQLRADLATASGQKKVRIIKRLEVVDAFRLSGNRPEWMILNVVPVIPPEIRPMVPIDGGRFATSDLNDLYRRVINRNNRLQRLLELDAPEIIVRNEKRMLQEAVDALINNGRRGRPVTGPNNRALKSLSDMLSGKQGRFRQNLLGKRVDYSGRSVIVVGPSLKIYQCGLPKEMALELFKPFVMKRLVENGSANNIKIAKKMVERTRPEVWDELEDIIKQHPVMLNRAPTLHRLGIQAFEPVLVEGRALKLHPLVCTAYNADFDGDQMAVHVPLSAEAQAEARFLMLSANNLLRPQDGNPVTVPTQDMILGCYWLTMNVDKENKPVNEQRIFINEDEVRLAFEEKIITIHEPIRVRKFGEFNGEMRSAIVPTTMGRIIFNEQVPQDLGYVDRNDPDHFLDYEIDMVIGKKALSNLISACIKKHGFAVTSEVLDRIKETGFHYSTLGAITISVADMIIPQEKKAMLAETEAKVLKIDQQYRRGYVSAEERMRYTLAEWEATTEAVSDVMFNGFAKDNPIFIMQDSGARGNKAQIRQLAGMRGLIRNTAGKTIETPIKSNYREGLTVLEYFTAARGGRKGLADTALRTADSGYLTRRLVDVSQEVIIREEDCGTKEGMEVYEIVHNDQVIEKFKDRLVGRYLAADFVDEATGEVLVSSDTLMTEKEAKIIMDRGVTRIRIRSVLACACRYGVCSKCYGSNLATGGPMNIGEAVGIIAAQSIGEPGTQLTMRTFHTGGVAGKDAADITRGLPRVEEMFEVRKPKRAAVLTEISGVVRIEAARKATVKNVNVVSDEGEVKTYQIPVSAGILVNEGDRVEKGQELTEGILHPQDVLRTRGVEAVEDYILKEVQMVYRGSAMDINDRHIEIIIRQMMKKVRVDDPGDTDLLLGSYVDKYEITVQNAKVQARIDAGETELKLAEYSQTLMGITRAALATDSFLSAASFQETNRILTDASIKGKIDPLIGTKENVIIGKLIPAGTGLERYRTSSEEKEDHISLPRNVGVNLSNPDFDLEDEEEEDEELTEAEIFEEDIEDEAEENEEV